MTIVIVEPLGDGGVELRIGDRTHVLERVTEGVEDRLAKGPVEAPDDGALIRLASLSMLDQLAKALKVRVTELLR